MADTTSARILSAATRRHFAGARFGQGHAVLSKAQGAEALERIGPILLAPEEADLLTKELNEEFPDIQHQAQARLWEKAPAGTLVIAE